MKFEFVHLISAHEKWAETAMSVYTEKISHFINFEIKDLGSVKSSRENPENKVKAESEKLLKYFKPDDFIVLFDERGETPDSIQFAKKIEKIMNSGKKRTVFIIGGAYGVGQDVRSRANLTISLSTMVLSHLVAEVVALEQIYRAFTILKNLPYHNK